MKLTVRFFARAGELAETEFLQVDLPAHARIAELKTKLSAECPALAPLMRHLLFAVGTDYATDETVLADGVEVACFPPVSGG